MAKHISSGFCKYLVFLLVIGAVVGQQGRKAESREQARRKSNQNDRNRQSDDDDDVATSSQCPEPNGYFADAEQCDKYYDCRDGEITEKLCPDGMVFNDYSPDQEKCDLPFNIDCSQRSKLQTPRPTQNCPRLHGYFAHSDTSICDQFYYCVDGKFNMITCPAGLVFSDKTGICTWADEAKKKGCGTKDVFNFECPKVNETFALTHPRYTDPDDCQYFYVCINGDIPRRSGCKLGQVFNDLTKTCDWARKVPECADWYKDQLTDDELKALENPPTQRPRVSATPFVSRRKPMRPKKNKSEPTPPHDDE